jgi:hypothetical protein
MFLKQYQKFITRNFMKLMEYTYKLLVWIESFVQNKNALIA